MFKKLLKNEAVQFVLVSLLVVGVIYTTVTGARAHYVRKAREQAQTLVGEHEIVNARYAFIGYVELYTSKNETLQVPISNDYGMRVATWFWGDPSMRSLPFKIRASYSEQAAVSTRGSETTNTDRMMAGTYLIITDVDTIMTKQK